MDFTDRPSCYNRHFTDCWALRRSRRKPRRRMDVAVNARVERDRDSRIRMRRITGEIFDISQTHKRAIAVIEAMRLTYLGDFKGAKIIFKNVVSDEARADQVLMEMRNRFFPEFKTIQSNPLSIQ